MLIHCVESRPMVPEYSISPISDHHRHRPAQTSSLVPPPPLTSDGPSSPTTSSFYAVQGDASTRRRPQTNPRSSSYKSTASTRHAPPSGATGRARPHASSSSPTSLSTVSRNARLVSARAARPTAGATRDLDAAEPTDLADPSVYGYGAMSNGEWEEWTPEEDFLIGLELSKTRREWRARYETALDSDPDEVLDESESEPSQEGEQCLADYCVQILRLISFFCHGRTSGGRAL